MGLMFQVKPTILLHPNGKIFSQIGDSYGLPHNVIGLTIGMLVTVLLVKDTSVFMMDT